MQIDRSAAEAFGGMDALAAAVEAYADAVDRHRFTVGEPAPSAPDLVARIAWAGGMEAVSFTDPPSAGPAPEARAVPALDFRRRFTPAERAAITLAASRGLERGDATLQLWLDDLNSALAVHLDSAEVAEGLAALVAAGLLAESRIADILA